MELFWLATAAVLGCGTLTCLGIGPRRRCDAVTGSLAVSIAAAVSIGKALLLAGVFRPIPVTAAALGCLAGSCSWLVVDRSASARAARTLRLLARRPVIRFTPVAWVAGCAVAAALGYFGYLGAHLPPFAWDSLYYHLISVSQWVRTGRLVSPIPGMHSPGTDVTILTQADSFPHDTELLAAWFAVFTRSVLMVQLAQVAFAPLLFAGTYGMCRHLGVRASRAVLGGATALLAPVVLSQVATDYVDVAQAAAVAAAWQFLIAAFPVRPDECDIRLGPAPARRASLVLCGVCLGLAAGVKASSLAFCAVALLMVVALSARRTRRAIASGQAPGWDTPRPLRSAAMLAVPMFALGSFWYLRAWVRWGSPTYPIAIGPFPGRAGLAQWANVGGIAVPSPWRGSGSVALLARDWAAALAPLRPPTLSGFSTPGLVWLLAALPAAIACFAIPAIRRRHLYGLLVTVVPLVAVTAISPVAWHARYSIPLLAGGGVAIAVLLDSGLPGRVADAIWRAAAPVAGTAVLALAVWQAWGQAENPSWNVPPGVTGVRSVLALASAPLQQRMNAGEWQGWNATQAGMSAQGAVGFFTQAPPALTLPFAGEDFSRAVVNIGQYPWKGHGPLPSRGRIEAMMAAAHVRYLYLPLGSVEYKSLVLHAGGALRPVPASYAGTLLELSGQPQAPTSRSVAGPSDKPSEGLPR